jgi:nucleoside 2-deoxyribosyltransferase
MADDRTKVYLAGPLFTQAERQWNLAIANGLSQHGFDMLVPQVLAERHISEHGGFDPAALFGLATDGVKNADVVVAILDGADPDSGTAFECAIAWSRGTPVVGLRTDFRKGGDGVGNVNLMLSASCREMVYVDSLLYLKTEDVVERLVPAIRAASEERHRA